MTKRFKITIEYDGSHFCGWQRQQNERTVQQTLEDTLFKFSGEQRLIEGSGRTDRGVHAIGQVAHFDLEKEFIPFKVQEAFNFHLKNSGVSIIGCEKVSDSFHARFSSIARTYKYYIMKRRAPSPLTHLRMWHVYKPLNVDFMKIASQDFIGHHNFSSFRAAECQSPSPMKTLTQFDIEEISNEIICATITSRSFLHNQVRIMMGTLKEIGEGKRPLDDIKRLLTIQCRPEAGFTAPAHGLYFYKVDYNDH